MKFLLPFVMLAIAASCNRQAQVDYGDRTHLTLMTGEFGGYVDKYGTVPDDIRDANGKPLLSWRVAILRFGPDNEVDLYNQFHHDEPWDSSHNKKVAENVPIIYADPKGSEYTPYLGVTGEKAAFRPGDPRPVGKDDGRRMAVVCVDTDKVKVHWTEPRDITLEEAKNGKVLRWFDGRANYLGATGSKFEWKTSPQGVLETPQFDFE